MDNFNGNQDLPDDGSNGHRNQDLRYRPIGYVTDGQMSMSMSMSMSRSSLVGSVNAQSLLSSFSSLGLSSPTPSPYLQQPQQSSYPVDYFDGGATPELSNNAEIFRQRPFPTLAQMRYPADFMVNNTNFNTGFNQGSAFSNSFSESGRWVFPTGADYIVNQQRGALNQRNPQQDSYEMNPFRQTGNQVNEVHQNDPSFLYNKNHPSGIPHQSNSPILRNPIIPSLYDLNQSVTGVRRNVPTTRSNPNHHQRQVRDINLPLSKLKGQIMAYAKDQTLCRVLQEKFESPSQEEVEMVVSEVIEDLQDLMTDQYGNYLFQKLIKECNEDQKTRIIWALCKPPLQLLAICQNLHGSRSVQKLLECVNNAEHISMITTALVPDTLDLATDPHGHHVLQQCFKLFSSEATEKLIRAMAENCFQIATNKSGCVVLHACVNECKGQAKALILREIIANTLHLAEDPYGNYVVQHVLELRIPKVNESILKQLKGNFFAFSRSKFASNVVEKCLSETEPAQAEGVIVELISNPNISLLLVDPFGNFVIQSAFIASQGQVQTNFLSIIQRNLPILRSNLYGKKIIQMLDKKKIRLI